MARFPISLPKAQPRALSPISELTTPASLRTMLTLPNINPSDVAHRHDDYTSEREGDGEEGSIYSTDSTATIRERHSTTPPSPPPRSPRRGSPPPLPSFDRPRTASLQFPAPGGLPPPPRTTTHGGRRSTSPSALGLHDVTALPLEVRPSSEELSGHVDAEDATHKTPFVATPDTFPNTLPFPSLPVSPSPSAPSEKKGGPRARLRKRPASFHGRSRPASVRGPRASVHAVGDVHDGDSEIREEGVGSFDEGGKGNELEKLEKQASGDSGMADKADSPSSVDQTSLNRSQLTSHQSDPSLPSSPHSSTPNPPGSQSPTLSTAPPRPRATSGRFRLMPNLFFSIFGTTTSPSAPPPSAPPTRERTNSLSRRLSRRSRRDSSRTSTADAELPLHEPSSPPMPAIRMSGTFGVRDDGSEIGSPMSPPRHQSRTQSTSGSAKSAALGTRRALWVENYNGEERSGHDEVDEGDQSGDDLLEDALKLLGAPHSVARGVTSDRYTPLTPTTPTFTSIAQSASPPGQPTSLRSLSDLSPVSSSAEMSPAPADARTSLPPEQLSPALGGLPKSPSSRPLPRPPSRPSSTMGSSGPYGSLPSGHDQAQASPHLHIPPPPLHTPSPIADQPSPANPAASPHTAPPQFPHESEVSDLPLLIASHLLTTHSAAMIRHSTSLREVSDALGRMAQESLDWGDILIRMSRAHHQGSLPPAATMADPLAQAYADLTSRRPYPPPPPPTPHTPRPWTSSQQTARQRKGSSLPADWMYEADRLGQEGWESLHRAEAAWRGAMASLREVVAGDDDVEREEDRRPMPTRASSGFPKNHESFLPALDTSLPRRSASGLYQQQQDTKTRTEGYPDAILFGRSAPEERMGTGRKLIKRGGGGVGAASYRERGSSGAGAAEGITRAGAAEGKSRRGTHWWNRKKAGSVLG